MISKVTDNRLWRKRKIWTSSIQSSLRHILLGLSLLYPVDVRVATVAAAAVAVAAAAVAVAVGTAAVATVVVDVFVAILNYRSEDHEINLDPLHRL